MTQDSSSARGGGQSTPPSSPGDHGGSPTRERFIDAGWDLIDGVGIREALRTISVSDIAGHAGRSERTFWNHFATWDDYIEALMSKIPLRSPIQGDDDYAPVAAIDAELISASRDELPRIVRAAARAHWREATRSAELTAFRRQLLLVSRSDPDGRLHEVLDRDYYGTYLPMLQRIYENTGTQTAAEPIAPFNFEELTRILAALSEGMLLQYIVSPDRVTTEFVVEVAAALVHSLVRPVEQQVTVETLELEASFTPTPLQVNPLLLQWAAECVELCESRRGDLRWSEVAATAGAQEAVVRGGFQRISVVAALGFGSVALEAIGSSGRTHTGDPGRILMTTDWLCELVRTARRYPWSSSRLLAERLGTHGDATVVKDLAPVGDDLANRLGEAPTKLHDRMVNVTITAALSDAATSPAEVSRAAVALHPALNAMPIHKNPIPNS